MESAITWTLAEWPADVPEEDLLVFLGSAERARWMQMRFEKRRKEWLLGRVTAKKLIKALNPSVELAAVAIQNEPEGAPYVERTGERLPGCLSVSHRSGLAAAAWSPDGTAIGIDLERIEPRADGFVEDYFTSAERDYIAGLKGFDRDQWVTCVWSAKEAVLKVLRKGLRLDTRRVEILPAADESLPPEWFPLVVRCELVPGVRACWRQYGEFMLTVAVERIEGGVFPRFMSVNLGDTP